MSFGHGACAWRSHSTMFLAKSLCQIECGCGPRARVPCIDLVSSKQSKLTVRRLISSRLFDDFRIGQPSHSQPLPNESISINRIFIRISISSRSRWPYVRMQLRNYNTQLILRAREGESLFSRDGASRKSSGQIDFYDGNCTFTNQPKESPKRRTHTHTHTGARQIMEIVQLNRTVICVPDVPVCNE